MKTKFKSNIMHWFTFGASVLGLSLMLILVNPWLVSEATAQEPDYNTAFLTDEQLVNYTSMTTDQIREFQTIHGSYFRQPVQDVDGVTFDSSSVIAQAASQYQINPQVILATLQKEHAGVTGSGRPSDTGMEQLMGCGTTASLPVPLNTARGQLWCAAERFRSYHNQLTDTGSTVSGWQVGVPKTTEDGVVVTPATKAVAGQFTYTPNAGVQWGGNDPRWGGCISFRLLVESVWFWRSN